MIPTILIYWILGLAVAATAGYLMYAQTNVYFKRGRSKAKKWVIGGLVSVDDRVTADIEKMKELRDQVFEIALEADRSSLLRSIDALNTRIDEISQRNNQLISKRDSLAEKPVDQNIQIDDDYYLKSEDAITTELAQIDKELAELSLEMSSLKDRSAEHMPETVTTKRVQSNKWLSKLYSNLHLWSGEVSDKLLILFFWGIEFALGLWLFQGLFLATSLEWAAWLIAAGVTLFAMVMAHTVVSYLARSGAVGRFLVNFAIPGVLLLLTVMLILFARLTNSIPLVEILMWAIFAGLIHYVALRSTDPHNPLEVALLLKAPLLLLINCLALVPVLVMWVFESGWNYLAGVFKASPVSDKERFLKKRIAELELDRKQKATQLDSTREQQSAFRKGEIIRTQQEVSEKIKLEAKSLDDQIESYNKSMGQLRSQKQTIQDNLDNLRRGSDSGTDDGVIVVISKRNRKK